MEQATILAIGLERALVTVEKIVDRGASLDERAQARIEADRVRMLTLNQSRDLPNEFKTANANHLASAVTALLEETRDQHSPEQYITYLVDALDYSSRLNSQHALNRRRQMDLIRCIIGNPFRPVPFAPAWRTSSAVALAETIYELRAFDRLPILADALEEAGCDQPEVLLHCRQHAVHARGCWVVDGVLGKM